MSESTEQPSLKENHDPSPLTWEGLWTLGPIILIAVLGGIANFSRKLSEGNARSFNIVELIGELFVSGFAGVMAYWLVRSWIDNPLTVAATVGCAGHAGSRFIFMVEKMMQRRAENAMK